MTLTIGLGMATIIIIVIVIITTTSSILDIYRWLFPFLYIY